MKRLSTTILLLMAIISVGFTGYIALWDIPAPSVRIEKVLPDDRFSR